jgi:hypothetical protein
VPSVDFRRSPGLDDLLAVAAETEPHVDALRDDYLANVGDAARQTADAIAALATPPGPGGGRAGPPGLIRFSRGARPSRPRWLDRR